MFKKDKRLSILLLVVALSVAIVGCSTGGDEEPGEVEDVEDNLGEELDFSITGIDAGAGIMQVAEIAIEEYDLDFDLQTSSGAVMTQALQDAIANEEPIIVTGWTPHWKFIENDLKYLDDPKEVFGGEETVNTLVRLGLEDEKPNAHKLLDQFNWKTEDMESVMFDISNGEEPKNAVRTWIEENEEKVDEWLEGVEEVDGEEIEIAYVAWDTNIASVNIVKQVMEDIGFEVTITQVEAGPMWAAVATGDADASLSAWLPVTDTDYYEDYKDELEDLGPNLEGAKVGLVVPTYMDIDSIEDLSNYKK